jgi:opacity protein-like surface antigen
MKLTTATFVTGLLLTSLGAQAAIKPGTHQLGLSLGAASPLSYNDIDGEHTRFGKTGPAIGAQYLYQYVPNLSFGGDLNLKALGERDVRTGHGTGQVDSSAWTLLAIARGDLLPDGDIRPYALLGLGFGGAKREVRFGDPRFDRDQTSGGLAFALAGGADLDINEHWLAGAELRYNYIHTHMDELGTESVRTLDLLFKVGYKF